MVTPYQVKVVYVILGNLHFEVMSHYFPDNLIPSVVTIDHQLRVLESDGLLVLCIALLSRARCR